MGIYSKYPLKVMEEVEPFPPIQNTDNPYLTEAAMRADQSNQLQGYFYVVKSVGYFEKLSTSSAVKEDYREIGETFLKKYDLSGGGIDKGGLVDLPRPLNGKTNLYGSNSAGAIKITLPIPIGIGLAYAMNVRLFGEQTSGNVNDSALIYITGSTGSLSLEKFTATIMTQDSRYDLPVRYGNDGTNYCLWIGETSRVFRYMSIGISDVFAGRGSGAELENWKGAFNISRVASFDTVDITLTNNLVASDFNKLKNKPVGVSGTFTSSDSKTVTVTDGIITSIV